MGTRQTLVRHAGLVMVRASTDPGGLDLPESLDLDTEDALVAGRAWLATLWRRAEVGPRCGSRARCCPSRSTPSLVAAARMPVSFGGCSSRPRPISGAGSGVSGSRATRRRGTCLTVPANAATTALVDHHTAGADDDRRLALAPGRRAGARRPRRCAPLGEPGGNSPAGAGTTGRASGGVSVREQPRRRGDDRSCARATATGTAPQARGRRRSCAETAATPWEQPRRRGDDSDQRSSSPVSCGNSPAGAGTTAAGADGGSGGREQPRRRGDDARRGDDIDPPPGTAPQARGRQSLPRRPRVRWEQPRRRGDDYAGRSTSSAGNSPAGAGTTGVSHGICRAGTAPQARGRLALGGVALVLAGNSPAGAGTTLLDLRLYRRGTRFSIGFDVLDVGLSLCDPPTGCALGRTQSR